MSHEEPQVRGEEGGGTEEEEGDLEARTAVEALLALTSPMDYTQHPGEHYILPHACTKHHAFVFTLCMYPSLCKHKHLHHYPLALIYTSIQIIHMTILIYIHA